MSKFAHTDGNGKILGWYDDTTHKTIPTPNIEISIEQWLLAKEKKHNFIDANGMTSKVDYRTHADIEQERILYIKKEAERLITEVYPMYKQNNILMNEDKTSQIFIDMVTFINHIRDVSNQAEINGTALADIAWK